MIREGDILYDCYPEEGIYSVFLVKGRGTGKVLEGWRCDLVQLYLEKDLVTARSDMVFTERYLSSLSTDPY